MIAEEHDIPCLGSDPEEKGNLIAKGIAEAAGMSKGEARRYYNFAIDERGYSPLLSEPPEEEGCLLLGYEEEDLDSLLHEEDGFLIETGKKLIPESLKDKFYESKILEEARVGYILSSDKKERIIERDMGAGRPVGPEDDRREIKKYMSLGYMNPGLNKFGQGTIKTTERGKKLLGF